ncbi:TIGR03557 family F420-dependent LLM class oxidoreductase [Patescibacteria group bacterium]|nr:TIGR03557 family F420-dependent LLM class oxidoreductase [Patescibacteria group bacterium]
MTRFYANSPKVRSAQTSPKGQDSRKSVLVYYFLSTEQFQPEVLVKHAVLAEKVGFDGVMISEHFHPWVDDKSAAGFAFSILGAIAVKTKKLSLITGVTTPLFRYHPAIVAQAAATIDRLSNGQFELGVGTGEKLNEGPLGFDFPDYPERAERMREAIEIMRRLLDGEKLTYKGKYYQTNSAKLYSPPRGKVPILMVAGGPKSANLASEMADGIITSVRNPTDTISKVISPARKSLGKSKKFKIVTMRWSIFARNEREAWEAIKSQRGLRTPNRDVEIDPEKLRKDADSLPREEILSKYSVASAVKDYIDIYKPLITEIRADTVVIQTTSLNQEKTIKMVGKRVLPELRKLR